MKWTINHLEDLNKVAAEFLDYVGDKTIFGKERENDGLPK